MIKESDVVRLTRDVQDFEVEFVPEIGTTIAVLTLESSDIQPERETIQARF